MTLETALAALRAEMRKLGIQSLTVQAEVPLTPQEQLLENAPWLKSQTDWRVSAAVGKESPFLYKGTTITRLAKVSTDPEVWGKLDAVLHHHAGHFGHAKEVRENRVLSVQCLLALIQYLGGGGDPAVAKSADFTRSRWHSKSYGSNVSEGGSLRSAEFREAVLAYLKKGAEPELLPSHPCLRIRAWRKERGLSQAALAKAMDVSRADVIYNWETGRSIPSPDSRVKIASLMGIPAGAWTPYAVSEVIDSATPGGQLRAWRKEKGWDTRRVADELGYRSEVAVHYLEVGRNNPRNDYRIKIEELTGISRTAWNTPASGRKE